MLNKVKAALRLTVNNYDNELTLMIDAALADLGLVGINLNGEGTPVVYPPLVEQAVITYCRIHFGTPDDFDRLKRSYDEQKAQLITATGYGFPEDEDGTR